MNGLIMNTRKSSSRSHLRFCFLGICTIGLIIWLTFYNLGIYPFGDNTLVYHDMQYQYLDFFMWFRGVLHGEDSIIYSFNMGLGGNAIALFAYYLASPLNLLCYFVKSAYMAEFLTLLIALKFMLCGVTSYIYVAKRFDISPFYAAIFSISYALMGYNVLQCSNIMWLDGVIILPLIALGIYHFWNKNKTMLYFVALFYGVLTNWYIGYMLCIFAALYFIFEAVIYFYENKLHLKSIIKKSINYILLTLLSIGATSFLFLPQTLFMMKEGESFDWSIFTPSFAFSYIDGFRDIFLEPDKLTFIESNPPVFVGSFVIIWCSLLFVSKNIDIKKKCLAAAYLLGFMFVFDYKPLNYMFTLFKVPSSHSYRYAFIYSFLMIVFAAMCINEIKKISLSELRNSVFVLLALLLFIDYVKPYSNREMVYFSGIVLCFIGIGITFSLQKNKVFVVAANLFILIFTITEFSQKLEMEFADHTNSVFVFGEYNKNIQRSVENLQKNDTGYYRIDKTFTRPSTGGCNNESMAFGYSAVSNYSSANNVEVAQLMKDVGYTGDTTVITYAPVLAMDSLLGIKYIYSDKPIAKGILLEENIAEGINLYKNPYALSIGYSTDILNENLEFTENPLENQEFIYENILNKDIELYNAAKIISQNTDYNNYIEWTLQVEKDGPLYLYFPNGEEGLKILANDTYLSYGNTWYNNQVKYVGDYKEGDSVTVKAILGQNGYIEDYGIYAETLNMTVFEASIIQLKENTLDINRMDKGHLSAEYSSKEESNVVLTIPYEEGWDIKINGQIVPYKKVLSSFIGLELPAGDSTIEMEYRLPGGAAGTCISILSIFLYILWKQSLMNKYVKEKIKTNRK